ncbi:MAG TPA: hypothetical protein VE085_00295 [Burkholderiales bacterium]|nr:hypothetical protein [Burkholderiales bacterium]
MKFTRHLFLLVAVLGPSLALAQFTDPQPLQRARDEYMAMLFSRSYDRLDEAARQAREKSLTTSDGQPLLGAIYTGAAGCACGNQLTRELWRLRKERLLEWRKRNPSSVTPQLALAMYPLAYGWFERGGGYGNTVNGEAMQAFAAGAEESRLALLALDAEAKADPGWFSAMLDVALAQGWSHQDFDALYQQAIAKYPEYIPFHFAGANYHSPRWYGSEEEIQRFVDQATTLTHERLGETLYARMNWLMASDEMFRTRQVEWKRMKAGFERMTKDYPDAWNVNNFAHFACMAGDMATVRSLLVTIGDKPIAKAWWNGLDYYAACRRYAESASASEPTPK